MSFTGQVAEGLRWHAVRLLGKQLVSIAVFGTLARILDPSAFGIVALVAVYWYFASMVADFGIGENPSKQLASQNALVLLGISPVITANTALELPSQHSLLPLASWFVRVLRTFVSEAGCCGSLKL
jgi:hypothetical protein